MSFACSNFPHFPFSYFFLFSFLNRFPLCFHSILKLKMFLCKSGITTSIGSKYLKIFLQSDDRICFFFFIALMFCFLLLFFIHMLHRKFQYSTLTLECKWWFETIVYEYAVVFDKKEWTGIDLHNVVFIVCSHVFYVVLPFFMLVFFYYHTQRRCKKEEKSIFYARIDVKWAYQMMC